MILSHIIKYVSTVQNISNKTIWTNRDISISGLKLNDDIDLNFNHNFISSVNYSMNLAYISSSQSNRFASKSSQFRY